MMFSGREELYFMKGHIGEGAHARVERHDAQADSLASAAGRCDVRSSSSPLRSFSGWFKSFPDDTMSIPFQGRGPLHKNQAFLMAVLNNASSSWVQTWKKPSRR